MRAVKTALLGCVVLSAMPARAADAAPEDAQGNLIVVTAAQQSAGAATKTELPIVQTPQAITVVSDDVYLAQGAISVGDTLRYVAGVQANPYGPDSRVDGSFIRGIDPLQFRDGMRDLFSYYASIRSDPYNFSRVEVVRGPASVLFGNSSLGGLVNMVSKVPEFETQGEISLVYGSFDRKEALLDVTGPLTDGLAGRIVARVRDANTQTDHVPDDRVMFAPSLTWRPSDATDVTLIGLYQEDDGGSTSQFLPLVGTLLPNPNGRLRDSLFIGKPGWDRYDGRLLQGTGIVNHRFSDAVKISLKARYIDSDVTYLTHYPDSYSNPANPYVQVDPDTGFPVYDPDAGAPVADPQQRTIGLYADGSYARLNVFSTDNNVSFKFDTGAAVEHVLLAGVDYSWNRVRKTGAYAYGTIDIYAPDYAALPDFGGGLPNSADPGFLGGDSEDTSQKQLGFYIQDQVRIWEKVTLILGGRRDHVRTQTVGSAAIKDNATSLRAGILAEVLPGVSPFFSYTESFEPISGTASNGDPFIPKRGRQFEGGIKFHPDPATLITLTAYHIKEKNRPVDDASTPDPFDQIQVGSLTSKGFEIEASRMLPGNYEIIANYSYVKARVDGTGVQLDNVPKTNASLWGTKTFDLGEARFRLGGGVRYSSRNISYGSAFPTGIVTPGYTLVDALAELDWKQWRFSVNATNLFDKRYYAACLTRGDCFNGVGRNVFGTVSYRF